MKIGRVFPDLLTPLGTAASLEDGLARTLARLVRSTKATAGALLLQRGREAPLVITARAAGRLTPALEAALRAFVAGTAGRTAVREAGPAAVRVALGAPDRPVGALALVGRRGLGRGALPAAFPRELGAAVEQVWRLHQQTVRITVLNEIMRLLVSGDSLDDVFGAFADGLARLVNFDAVSVALLDPERAEFDVLDVLARSVPGVPPRDARMALAGSLLEAMIAAGAPLNVPDLAAPDVPPAGAAALAARGYRAAVLAPLATGGGVFGAVTVAACRPGAFEAADVEILTELARPLASAIEQRRLLEESRRRAEELAALYSTSQLITARLDVASVLDRICGSVTSLIGSSGCGIGLLDASRAQLVYAAAHGFKSEQWRALTLPMGEGIMGRCAASEAAIRVDDVQGDPRSARRDVDERENIRSMLCVPLRVAGTLLGVISAFSTRPAAFSAHHQRVLEAFAEQAGIAIHNAQLFEESVRRARETHALFEAGRAVTASLDPERTIHVIMEQARAVLGVESCGIYSFDAASRELVSVASLDLPREMVSQVRLREGQGISGRAVQQGRPLQSADMYNDPRVRYPHLPRQSGLRSMLTAPLRVGERIIGAISVFRRDVHEFSKAEEELLVALADQAAIALEHARLYADLEGMVADRTRELDSQKRFVEVVLETLPLGVFVLDPALRIVRANRDGAGALGGEAAGPSTFAQLLGPAAAAPVEAFLRDVFAQARVATREDEVVAAGERKVVRLTAAPLTVAGAGEPAHIVVLVEDVTLAKALERQMLLTERLTTAGRLAAGVAHELNNPIATIAGCAESLRARLKESGLDEAELGEFPAYLALIEEEAFRCKEITGSLLQFVREPGSRRQPTDLNALVHKTIELLSHQSRFAYSEFATELDPALPEVTVNEGQLRQVFLGLASNALEAMDGRGRLTIRSRMVRREVEVEFEDEGPGMTPDVAGRVFDPFFTTKPPGQGTGLGLAIAQSFVNDHGGRIELESSPGHGAAFRVILPA